MSEIKKLGWIKDSLDPRDYRLAVEAAPIVRTISLFEEYNIPPVYDQGNLGSCVSNAIAAVTEFKLMNKSLIPDPSAELYMPSRLFNYYYGRKIEGTIPVDSGLAIRDGLKALASKGISDENLWPYDISKFKNEPSEHAKAEGQKFKAGTYRKTTGSLTSFLTALEMGNPIIFGFAVFESFMSDKVAETGDVPLPDVRNEEYLGGHCVAIWGYNKDYNYVLCRNSWGKNWGVNGYFHMPLAYVTNPALAGDFWILDNLILG